MKNQNAFKSGYLFPAILVIAIIGLVVLLFVGHEWNNGMKKADSLGNKTDTAKSQDKSSPNPLLPAKSAQKIIEDAESQIEKKAVLEADVEAIREKSEQQAALPQPAANISPFAPISPEIYENPPLPAESPNVAKPVQNSAPGKLPPKIYALQGRSNTTTISTPSPPIAVPDPYTPPPIKVNPERVQK